MRKSLFSGVLMVLGAAVLWGTTGTAQSLAPGPLSPYWVGALRLAIASLFFAFYAAVVPRKASLGYQLRALPWRWVMLAGACMAIYNLTFFAGVKASGVAVGTALALGSGPVWAGLLQISILRKMPRAAWWTGTLLAVAGGSLMVLGKGAGLHASVAGIALCLAAGLVYAIYALVNKHLVSGAAPAIVTLSVFTFGALIAVPIAAISAGGLHIEPAGWVVVAYLGVVATGVAYLLFSTGLQTVSGATGVSLALMEPLTAFLLAIVVVGEHPGLLAFLGLAGVLAGLALVILAEVRADRV